MTQQLSRYYVYIKKSVRGPFYPKDIALQPGFGGATLVCPENALGQWREAQLEAPFQQLLNVPPQHPVKPRPPMTPEAAEETASRSLLEKAIGKNARLENEVKDLRRAYNKEKHSFEETIKRKDAELHALTEKLRRSIANAQAVKGEHPSWEMLYKTLKKRSEEKLSEATQAIAEKIHEAAHVKERMLESVEKANEELRKQREEHTARAAAMEKELQDLRSQLEERDLAAGALNENIQTLVLKNEEFQRIMFDERRDYETQAKNFCEEIGRLRSDLKWREQELSKLREELFAAVNQIKEFEASESLKSREQEETYSVIRAKMKMLTDYFENLEARVKFAFKKA